MFFLPQTSSTFQSEGDFCSGTPLTCDCGWRGPLREASYLELHKRNGDIVSVHYLCKTCGLVLVTEKQYPAVSQVDAANKNWSPPHKREEEK